MDNLENGKRYIVVLSGLRYLGGTTGASPSGVRSYLKDAGTPTMDVLIGEYNNGEFTNADGDDIMFLYEGAIIKCDTVQYSDVKISCIKIIDIIEYKGEFV